MSDKDEVAKLAETVALELANMAKRNPSMLPYSAKEIEIVCREYAEILPKWKPIETAPSDRDVEVYNVVTGPYRTRMHDGIYGVEWPCYFWGRKGVWTPAPTHWKELTEPPK